MIDRVSGYIALLDMQAKGEGRNSFGKGLNRRGRRVAGQSSPVSIISCIQGWAHGHR
jgi:hypothetical protein